MENRKRQLKTSRRIMTRRNAYNHGRTFRPLVDNQAIIVNYPSGSLTMNTHHRQQRNHHVALNNGAASTSMRAFSFNVDSLVRNQNFLALPKESADRRIVKDQNSNRIPLYRNPTPYNMLLQGTYVLGGVNYDLGLDKPQFCGKLTSEYFRFLKKLSGKTAPSDRDIIFGNARMLLKQANGWEKSRIQWLLDLEHRQEMRRTRTQLCEDDYVNMCCFPFSGNMLMWNAG